MKITKIAALILALVMACGLLSACGGSQADKDLVKLTETWNKAKDKYDTDYAAAAANNDRDAAINATNTALEAAKSTKSSLEKIDKSKLSDANKKTYDQTVESITSTIAVLEDLLAQYENTAIPDEGAPEDYVDEEYAEEEYEEG